MQVYMKKTSTFGGASDSKLQLGVVIIQTWTLQLKNQWRFYTFIVKALGVVLDRGFSFSAQVLHLSERLTKVEDLNFPE